MAVEIVASAGSGVGQSGLLVIEKTMTPRGHDEIRGRGEHIHRYENSFHGRWYS
jgi:hypothetical protein